MISETPDKVGTKIKMVVDSDGKTIEITETVTQYKANEMVELYFEAGEMLKTDNYSFTSDGKQTTILAKHTCEGSNLFYKSMFSFFKSMFKKIDQDYLNNFKAFAEKTN